MSEYKGTLFSIGHGARKIDEFIRLLKQYDISYVIDVRSKPRSRFNPQYNQSRLSESLLLSGIRYVFMGDNLGGLPKDPSCYDSDGHVVYANMEGKEFFREGVSRLLTAHEKSIRIACMCSEIDACDCHRSKLIGEVLSTHNVPMLHISREGGLDSQETIMRQVGYNSGDGDLFSQDKPALRSRKSYR
jgi:uncharacterized protein (DUF488 family)